MPQSFQRTGIVFVISAPSGTGKTTLSRRLVRQVPGLRFSTSCTTRPARAGEEDGADYRFVSERTFKMRRRRREFLEWAMVDGQYYGTPRREIVRLLEKGTDVLLDVDTQGAEQIRRRLSKSVLIFLLPPGPGALKRRHHKRGSKSEAISRRLALARQEVGQWKEYDYLIVNENLERAYRSLEAIVRAERCRSERQRDRARYIVKEFRGPNRQAGT